MRKGVANTPFRKLCLQNNFTLMFFLFCCIPFVYSFYTFMGLGFSFLAVFPALTITLVFGVALEMTPNEWEGFFGTLIIIAIISFVSYFWNFRF